MALGLVVRLSCRAVFGAGDLAECFADALIERHWLANERRDQIMLALHEALANAVIHGNLGLGSGDVLDIQAFIAQGQTIERRLDDPAYGLLPITLIATPKDQGVVVSVQDSGSGFTAPPAISDPNDMEPESKHGRGMGLMRVSSDGMHYEDQGRRVVLFFGADGTPS